MTPLEEDLASLRLSPGAVRTRGGRRWWWAAGLLLIVCAVAGWRWATASVDVETVSPTIETGGAAPGTPMLTAAGYVVARRRAVVSAKIQGRLAELRVEEGSRVGEGEVFARLESADFEAALARANATLARADAQVRSAGAATSSAEAQVTRAEADLAEYRRQQGVSERLVKEEVAPVDQAEAARSRVRVAEAIVGQAQADLGRARAVQGEAGAERDQARADVAYNQAQLQNTYIRAPFAGTVVRKMAEVGESVAPIPPGVNISTASGAIVALADLDTLEVEVDVAEANVSRLLPGQPAVVTVEAFPDREYKGVLRQVIPTADRTRATVLVRVTMLDKDDRLKPEMSARVTFVQPPRAAGRGPSGERVVLVPQTAVLTGGGGSRVLLVTDGRVASKAVTLGSARQDRVVVADGLSGAETLVLQASPDLADGARVRVKGR